MNQKSENCCTGTASTPAGPGTGEWTRGLVEHRIPTNLGVVHVRVGGLDDGPTMVFWPSLVMTAAMWRHQYEHFARTHRVVLIDAPGIGKSDRLTKAITLDECSDCLIAVLDSLGLEKCVLVGNSWGAILAGVFAAEHPDRLVAAVAANGTAFGTTLIDRIQLGPLVSLLGRYARAPKWFAAVTRSTFAGTTAKAGKPDFLAALNRVLDEDPRSMAWQMRSILLRRRDIHRQLHAIAGVPVLVIAGAEDRQFSVATVRDFAATILGSTFAVLPDTGHLSALESPDLFNETIDDFLARIDPS